MNPGPTAFTRMPFTTSSAAKTCANARSAAFDPAYTLRFAVAGPCASVVNTIAPPARISGASRCVVKYAPFVLMSNMWSYVSSVTDSSGPSTETPALMNRKSMCPSLSSTTQRSALMSAKLAVSVRITCAPGRAFRAGSMLCSFRPVSSTSAPPSSKAFAIAKPIPCVPPLMTAFFPENLDMLRPVSVIDWQQ